MEIIIYSIGRSGSTLIRQIAEDLFPHDKITVLHNVFNEENDNIIIVYRDFRDVLVSHWRTHENIDLNKLKNGYKAPLNQLNKYLDIILDRINTGLDVVIEQYPNALLLKYELFFNNFDYIFEKLESRFKIKITNNTKNKIIEKYSLNSNKKRQEKLKSFNEWDERWIHGLHIYNGKIGVWKDIIDEKDKPIIIERFKPHLIKWNYLENK